MKTSRRIFDSETMREIGAKLRAVRGDRTLSQFATSLGLARTTWSNYEAGRRLPSHEVLERLRIIEGISAEQILPVAQLQRSVRPHATDDWFSYIPVLWLFSNLNQKIGFTSESEALTWWAARVSGLVNEFESRAFDIAEARDVTLVEGALLVCDDLKNFSQDELLRFIEGI